MREIKFRYYDPSIKAMLTPSCVGEFGFYAEDRDFEDGNSLPFDRLMQYTGLHDKNGNEIYEGDIVDLHPDDNNPAWHRVIEWDTAAFHCKQIHGKANHPLHFHKHSPEPFWVVIGNIYENPELLKP